MRAPISDGNSLAPGDRRDGPSGVRPSPLGEPSARRDPRDAILALAAQNPALALDTSDLCFVCALCLRARATGAVSFAEDELFEVFDQVASAVAPGADGGRRRGAHVIRRLREQRLLVRVDGAGVVRAGDYALTKLATGIAEFLLEDESLSQESLTALMRGLVASLESVRDAARSARSAPEFQANVLAPLRTTVKDLLAGIERRQRGVDLSQESLQRKIAHMLESDWLGAVDRCQALLEDTSTTLREISEVLLRYAQIVSSLLQEIEEAAATAAETEAGDAAARLLDQVDRLASWGAARQRTWSEYYQFVLRFLRDVVRLDPTRALTERLREQLTGRLGRSFALTVAASPSPILLRAVVPPAPRATVRRPRTDLERPLDATEQAADEGAALECRVRAALDKGARGLGSVTIELTAELPTTETFVTAGRIAETVARLARPRSDIERPWVPVPDGIAIEDWELLAEKAKVAP